MFSFFIIILLFLHKSLKMGLVTPPQLLSSDIVVILYKKTGPSTSW